MLGIGRWAATVLLWAVVGLARRKKATPVMKTHNRDTEEIDIGVPALQEAIRSVDRRLMWVALKLRRTIGGRTPALHHEIDFLLDERLAYMEALAHADVC